VFLEVNTPSIVGQKQKPNAEDAGDAEELRAGVRIKTVKARLDEASLCLDRSLAFAQDEK
jgi:hypothetical protein